ncbi:hypothetical protein DPMN_158380 [Dreissena polymorpha]|uniref:Uncharacterized protein n=2 Tax=Dreissena polymorpha TaxID=45954 RepID=A0A9D4EJ22_DREPO|nr:hypothetical protein DPMN_158380 [Dreissena polymorpha]
MGWDNNSRGSDGVGCEIILEDPKVWVGTLIIEDPKVWVGTLILEDPKVWDRTLILEDLMVWTLNGSVYAQTHRKTTY